MGLYEIQRAEYNKDQKLRQARLAASKPIIEALEVILQKEEYKQFKPALVWYGRPYITLYTTSFKLLLELFEELDDISPIHGFYDLPQHMERKYYSDHFHIEVNLEEAEGCYRRLIGTRSTEEKIYEFVCS